MYHGSIFSSACRQPIRAPHAHDADFYVCSSEFNTPPHTSRVSPSAVVCYRRCYRQAPGQGTGQAPLHPAIAAGLPGAGMNMMLPGMGAMAIPGSAAAAPAAVPAAAPAAPAAAPAAVPRVVGTPTFCLLVKNMFDPLTETDEGWELDIKEEMEEVPYTAACAVYLSLCRLCSCVRIVRKGLCFVGCG